MRLDRFTFHNDTKCYVELGSEEEAAKAVAQLHNVELQGKNIVVTPLKADFQWGAVADKSGSPYGSPFYDENNGAQGALRPLIERRRIMLQVQTPGWTTDLVNKQTKNALRIIEQTFDMYGVEKVGPIHPFYGDKKQKPRLLCFMDFKTKEGADEAIRNHHNTMIEGRLTWLTLSTPVSYRTHHIQKVAPKLVADLQEQGLLPKETREDKFINPMPRNESK
jgi:RNA recognition motif-containing protein